MITNEPKGELLTNCERKDLFKLNFHKLLIQGNLKMYIHLGCNIIIIITIVSLIMKMINQ